MLNWLRKKYHQADGPVAQEVTLSEPEDAGELIYWADSKLRLRILAPAQMLSMQGAFSYAGGWHPFVQALAEGPSILSWFYRRFQPQSLEQMYFLSVDNPAMARLPPWEIPWLTRRERLPPPGELGLGPEHGVSYYGPASPAKVSLEYQRLTRLRVSIRSTGYDPDRHGDISGFFLRHENRYRFFVRGGKHRAAVLVAFGEPRIPVTFKPNFPRLIDRRDVQQWPLVRSGALSAEFALAIFDRYFQFNGVQQRAQLAAGSTGGGQEWILTAG